MSEIGINQERKTTGIEAGDEPAPSLPEVIEKTKAVGVVVGEVVMKEHTYATNSLRINKDQARRMNVF